MRLGSLGTWLPQTKPWQFNFPSPLQEISVRVCFILGNLTADDREVRERLYFSLSALPVLEGLSERYLDVETRQAQVRV